MEPMRQITLNIPPTTKPRVVIVGAGFGGLNAAKNLPDDKFQVVLFDKHNYHTFQPLLYQVASAALQPDAIAGPLRNLFHDTKDFHFRMLRVLSVDPLTNTINTSAGSLQYDYLIISSGARTNYFGNENMQRFALPLKTIPDALNMRSHLMQIFEWASLNANPALKEHMLNIVLVGAGPTGVEMAGAFSELRKYVLPKDYPILDFSKMKIYLLEGVDRVLPPMHPKSSARAQRYLEKMGVIIKLNAMVQDYDGETITLKSGEQIKSFFVVWSAGVMGEVLAGIPKEWTERGRILTDPFCRAIGSTNIFAIGDIALMKLEDYPRGHPGVAQPAIQMGKYVAKNLFALHRNETVKPFKYFDKGSLATVGRGKAVADLPGDIHLGGRLAWYIWLFVHVNFLVSFRNKLLVMTNWIWNLFTFDKGNRLIIRPYIRKGDEKTKTVFAENQVGS
ncbi:NAD(P)/FAD-dependent oxidoreductase [Chitinophaga filiformis]|uniref:NAD(P)/FAD-dependent oxidoreductase n=1 Tax=Chitinophaga filiformis TaxID=104663 RepID=UPI001F3E195E|nr:NAD(P)/FAD-dependent oxidoreductase [Chitinophaga filiformis]MCF6406494.1 NAD(P)/FAD-dependent oxidoreductase [Chitinophaga filiformis]